MTSVPVDPTKAVNETEWKATELTYAKLEKLKSVFLTCGVRSGDAVLPQLHPGD